MDTVEEKPVEKRPRGRPRKYESVEERKEKFSNEYFRLYYHEKLKSVFHCPSCGKDVCCKSSLARHLKGSRKCKTLRENSAGDAPTEN